MDYSYPFDEFAKHYDEIYPALVSDDTPHFGYAILATSEYMKQRHDDKEAVFKTCRFMLAVHYLSAHIEEFDTGDFAVYGSPKVGALVSNHLFRAIHHWFIVGSTDQLRDPTANELLDLAASFRDKQDG